VGVDVHDSGTAGTEAVVPGDGLGKEPAAPEAGADGLAVAAVDADGEREALELPPHATSRVSATSMQAG
jgi:hypothetical protein